MHPLIRSQVLTGYASLARSFGIAPEPLAKSVGLDLSALADPDARIPANAFAELLARTADVAKSDDFGLRLAMSRTLGILGPVGLVSRDQKDVRSAFNTLASYVPLHNEVLGLRIVEKNGLAILSIEMHYSCAASTRQVAELTVGAFFRFLCQFLGPRWKPLRVCFRHCRPENLLAHRRFFNCPVEFGQDFNGIVCLSAALDTPVAMADSAMTAYAHRHLESIGQLEGMPTTVNVRKLIRLLLPTGECTINKVASRLGMDRRTIHRSLRRAGETFSTVRNQIRKDLASELLATDSTFEEIAARLGFSDPTTFSRWVKQAFGCSPTTWRRSRDNRH